MAEGIQRIEHPLDPQRCQAVTSTGQCNLKATPGKNYCIAHGGAGNYKLRKWDPLVREKAQSPGLKNLTEEIAILRVLLEQKLNDCRNPNELIIASASIGDLIIKIEKLVASCHKMDLSLSKYLDQRQVLNLMDKVLNVIQGIIDCPETLRRIADGLAEIIDENDTSDIDN